MQRGRAKMPQQHYDSDRLYYAYGTSQLCLRMILSRYALQVVDDATGLRPSTLVGIYVVWVNPLSVAATASSRVEVCERPVTEPATAVTRWRCPIYDQVARSGSFNCNHLLSDSRFSLSLSPPFDKHPRFTDDANTPGLMAAPAYAVSWRRADSAAGTHTIDGCKYSHYLLSMTGEAS